MPLDISYRRNENNVYFEVQSIDNAKDREILVTDTTAYTTIHNIYELKSDSHDPDYRVLEPNSTMVGISLIFMYIIIIIIIIKNTAYQQ